MSIGLYIIFFIFGAIIGSFLNVVIYRFNTGRSVSGRSFCPNCSRKIAWYDLAPIFSWLFLKGKCRHCRSKISPQYPLVEFFTGLLFALLIWHLEPILFSHPIIFAIFFCWVAVIFSVLIVIFVYDLKHKIIPDSLSYLFAIMALAQTILLLPMIEFNSLIFWLDLLAGPILFLPFWAMWFFSGGTWIGLGDGKLVIGIGWFLGFIIGLNAVLLAFIIGAITSLFIMITQKYFKIGQKLNLKSEIAFGPFLILAVVLQFFLRYDFLGLNFFFF